MAVIAGGDPAGPAAVAEVRGPGDRSRPRSPPWSRPAPVGPRTSSCRASSTTARWRLLSLFTVAIRRPLVGFIIGAAIGDPTGWIKDRGLVKMTSKLTLVLAVPYVTRFVIQLPLFLAGQVVWLAVAKVVARLAAAARRAAR